MILMVCLCLRVLLPDLLCYVMFILYIKPPPTHDDPDGVSMSSCPVA